MCIRDRYDNSLAKIKLEKFLSPAFKIEKGTEQGHPMSPELFKIYILDLSTRLSIEGDFPCLMDSIVNHLLWADDLILLALNEQSLQNILNILNDFCKDWDLEINLKKTKILAFGSRKHKTKFTIGDQQIDYADRYCYLGIIFDINGSFTPAFSELRKKSLRALFGLKRYIMRDSLSFDATLKLFDSLIKPVLLYACQILVPHTFLSRALIDQPVPDKYFKAIGSDMYEKFQLKFLKWDCGVHRKTSNLGILGDTGRYPITINAIKLAIDYYGRIENFSEHTLLRKAFEEQRTLNLDWYNNVSTLISAHNIGRSNITSINVSERLNENFRCIWLNSVHSSEKLTFYKSFKSNFQREEYLKLRTFIDRSNICKLRISAHRLSIEQGRYTTPITPRRERACIYCLFESNIIAVENEVHVLSECPLYRIPIKTFTNVVNRPILDVLKHPQNIRELQKFGALCTSVFDIHEAFLEYTKLDTNDDMRANPKPCINL